MGRNKNRDSSIDLNYDSLLDIISNILGIMIFLAIIIVLLPSSTEQKVIEVQNITESEHPYLHQKMPVIVDIPWSRMEEYENIVIAIAYDKHLIHIDFELIYNRLKHQAENTFYFDKDIKDLYNISSYPVVLGDAKNAWFSFSPPDSRHAEKAYKPLDEIVAPLSPSKTRMVFFVYPSGHEIFHDYYHRYRKSGYNISWFAIPSEEDRHFIGYSHDGTKVEAE